MRSCSGLPRPKGLAETSINRLPRRYAPRRDGGASLRTLPVFANPSRLCEPFPSLRTPPRHCERSEAIHLANHSVPDHRLPRPSASQRQKRVIANSHPVFANPRSVFANAVKQSTSQTTRYPTMDCHGLKASQRRVSVDRHVATLLAVTSREMHHING